MKFTSNDAEHLVSLFVLRTLFCRICTRKMGILKTHFFDHYCTLAASLYSSNDFRTVTHKFVSGLLVLLHHKCICLSIKHLTMFRTCTIVLVFIHHSNVQQCIFSKMTGPSTLPFGEGKFFEQKNKINELPRELHHMYVVIAYPQNIAALYRCCLKEYHLSSARLAT